jgi:ribonuclease HI
MPGRRAVELWADGSADGDGFGGWAFILIAGSLRREGTGADTDTTNNRMEITAVLEGLAALKMGGLEVTVYTDSNYVVGAFEQGWLENWRRKGWKRGTKPIPNSDLWIKLDRAVTFHHVRFEHVPGHSGMPENERCDYLAGRARRELRTATPFNPSEARRV